VVRNPGHGDCLAYALADASYGFFPAFSSRPRAQDFLSNNPAAPAVRALSAAEAATLVEDGFELTDNQARIFSLAFSTDIFFLAPLQILLDMWNMGRVRFVTSPTPNAGPCF